MAFTQISTSVTIINTGLIGYQGISLTNLTNTTAPSVIAAGSVVEIGGAFFKAGTDITPNASSWTAITTATSAYLYLTPSGSAGTQVLSASYLSTKPVWSTSKQGWYASVASVSRAIMASYKSGTTTETDKQILYDEYSKAVLVATNTSIGSKSLQVNTGLFNTAIGDGSLQANTTGTSNVAIGRNSLTANTYGDYNIGICRNTLNSNITGSFNVAIGYNALGDNIADSNIAIGHTALTLNTTGTGNIAIGTDALDTNTTGVNNIAIGINTLTTNAVGFGNIAIGTDVLAVNTVNYNIGIGTNALKATTTGYGNIAIGQGALEANVSGYQCIAIGHNAQPVTNGISNCSIGANSLNDNTEGTHNAALGGFSLSSNTIGIRNSGIGEGSLYTNTTGSYNSGVGNATEVNGQYTYCTVIGAEAIGLGNSRVRLGRLSTDITYAYNIQADSDIRLKEQIKDIPIGLDFIKGLRPVFYKWKDRTMKKINPETKKEEKEIIQFKRLHAGFIAQEVGELLKKTGVDFGIYHDDGYDRGITKEEPIDTSNFKMPQDLKSITPEQFIPILVKAVQELSARVEYLEKGE